MKTIPEFTPETIGNLPIGRIIWEDAWGTIDTWEYDIAIDFDSPVLIDTFGRFYKGELNTIVFLQATQLGNGYKKMVIPNSGIREIVHLDETTGDFEPA